MKKLILLSLILAFFSACEQKQEQSSQANQELSKEISQSTDSQDEPKAQNQCSLKVFGAAPPISVLLELLYPEGMIGLNYKPYPEDVSFMPEGVADLPILGHTGGNLNFEQIASLKPDVMFFSDNTLDSVIEPYAKIGIESVKIPAFFYEQSSKAIEIISESLSKNEQCIAVIKPRSENLLAFLEESENLLKKAQDILDSQISKEEHLQEKIDEDSNVSHIKAHSLRPRVYFAQGFDGLKTQCGDEGDLAYKLGGINAIACESLSNAQGQTSIDFELLASLNPEVIFVREIGFFNELINNPNPKWQELSALKNKQVFYAPSSPSNWLMRPPSILQSIGLVWGLSKIHPELISDEVVKDYAQRFYRTFLQPLSDEEYQRLQGL
ncbi:MAG: ABC transporter substrate-binding protein [Helicobacter sp.]|uniref:ABC transporter substrate-binding protein n=1 Tax=Helicobacter sp. TaxID=218 RepID=UPI0025C3CB72|nr:ABC transporter substrate-binding protein [Helicobacter sp.]MCH5314075.1 ABC transporter substrate-binding protein [Helicobacter sp.]